MQRDTAVRRVEGLPALARLGVDRAARLDERRHVGDRVVEHGAAGGALEVQGLVEIGRAGRVDRHERDAAQVGQSCGSGVDRHGAGRGIGLGEHRGREVVGQIQLVVEGREGGRQLVARRGRDEPGAQDGHDASVGGGSEAHADIGAQHPARNVMRMLQRRNRPSPVKQ